MKGWFKMPWDTSQVEKHYGGLDDKHKRMWKDVANSALKSCLDKGGDAKECEVSAIKQASSVVKKSLSEDSSNSFYYLTEIDDSILKELEDKTTITIDIFREGSWQHPRYGKIEGNKKLFNDLIANWKSNSVGREIILDKNHHPEDGGTGIVKDLFIEADKLRAKVELTNFGIDLIKNKGFRYFSPEYTSKYTNKETGVVVENVLIGGALTTRPFLTNLAPIILSEQFSNDFCQEKHETVDTNDLKDEMWLVLQEYANNDEEKIRSIMDVMNEHMKEAMAEMKSDNGKIYVKNIIKNHMQMMMKEIMDEMVWSKTYAQVEEKSNH